MGRAGDPLPGQERGRILGRNAAGLSAKRVTESKENPMQKIVPNLWFQGNAAEGVEFYEHALPNTRVGDTSHYPTEGLLDFQEDFAGELLT